MRWSRRLGVWGALAVATVAIAGIAFAQIPDGGVISGCYAKGGALRVIDASSTSCKQGETLLQWNQKGVPGTNGTNGSDGVDGSDGADGADGVSGYTTQHMTFIVEPQSSKMQSLACPRGTRPLGGGGHAGNVFNDKGISNITNAYIAESDITDTGDGWAVTAVNRFTDRAEFSIDVICAAV